MLIGLVHEGQGGRKDVEICCSGNRRGAGWSSPSSYEFDCSIYSDLFSVEDAFYLWCFSKEKKHNDGRRARRCPPQTPERKGPERRSGSFLRVM